MVDHAFTRRTFLGAAATLAAPSIARAEPVPLVLGTNGGEEYKAMYEAVYRPFEQQYNVKIVPLFGDGATLLNRAIAEKARPSMDVTVTYQGGWEIGKAEGVFEKVDYKNIPNADTMYDFLREKDGYGPFCNFSAWGIAYNKDTVPKPPLSFKDLWKPEYKGQWMVGGIYHWQIHLTAFAYAWTGDQSKIDVAFDKMKEVAPRLAGFYGLTSDAQSKFVQGIGDIATWYSRTVQRLRADGVPLAFQVPEEGAFIYPIAYQAIKGTQKLDLVEKLMGQFYDPARCLDLARLNGYIPANRNVKLPPELASQMLTYEDVLRCHNWDWSLINANQDAWLTRWNAEIRPLLKG
jgi:putative spermidine/putrescine transport system substrate-binding protein